MPIIGITGTFGSGCTFIAKRYFESKGYKHISLSKYLKEQYSETEPPTRKDLQDLGNKLRQVNGNDWLAKQAIQTIKSEAKGDAANEKYVIDSIRNTAEIIALRTEYGDFFLLGVNADPDIRWERVRDVYSNDPRLFEQDEKRDKEEDVDYGQQVTKCFERADYIIINNDDITENNDADKLMGQDVLRFLKLVDRDSSLDPYVDETAMASAYAASHRSSCLKRKVGAIIMDKAGGIFSSGYNEVPPNTKTCRQKCGQCYRGHLRTEFRNKIDVIIQDSTKTDLVYDEFKNNIKLMDYCRALHAEENAILGVIRNGASGAVKGSTLYTTTFPCNLCANKIAEIGVSKVVYAAPYPMKEAKQVLASSNVECVAFHGITYLGYFKMEGNFI